MRLAEALLERKNIKEEINDLRERLERNVKVQEGDTPTEEPEELLARIKELAARLETLIIRINRTNIEARLPDGSTLMEAIARRDILKLRYKVLEAAAEAATTSQNRFMRTEIKFQATVDVGRLRREIDALAKAYRELDTQIQAANWNVDLVDG